MNPSSLTATQLAAYIDHALLKPDATVDQIEQLCAEAREHGFYSVCVHGAWIAAALHFLEGTGIRVCGTVGFPLGAMQSDVKRYETEAAIDDGAHEIDVVLNIGRLKQGDDKFVLRELIDIAEAADERTVKVILETGYLSEAEKIHACQLIVESGAHFVKTSTGFGPAGATVADVQLLRQTVGPKFGVKASGGIRDTATALAMIQAGASRLGTSSSVAIIQGLS
jgi:deoxyribose-phosphate aldolase